MAEKQLSPRAGVERPGAKGRAPYVVGIGASAGGLQPLQEFFSAMPRIAAWRLSSSSISRPNSRV